MDKIKCRYSVLVVLLFVVVCFFACYIVIDRKLDDGKSGGNVSDNSNNDSNNLNSDSNVQYVLDDYISFVYECGGDDTDFHDICGMSSDGNSMTLVSDVKIMYGAFDVSNGYLYYIDKQNFLHSLSLDEEKVDTNLNFLINDNFWKISVDGDNVFVFYSDNNGFGNEIVNMNSFEVQKLPFIISGLEYFKNNKIYFTDKDNGNLYFYDVISKEKSLVSTNSSIFFKDKNSFFYVKDKNELYLYDIELNSSDFVKEFDSIIDSSYNILYIGDVLYYIFDDSGVLYRYQGNELKELVAFDDKIIGCYNMFDLFKINDSLLLIKLFDFSSCDESGSNDVTEKNYLYDINSGILNETSLGFATSEVIYNK